MANAESKAPVGGTFAESTAPIADTFHTLSVRIEELLSGGGRVITRLAEQLDNEIAAREQDYRAFRAMELESLRLRAALASARDAMQSALPGIGWGVSGDRDAIRALRDGIDAASRSLAQRAEISHREGR